MKLMVPSGRKAVCLLNKGQAALLTPHCGRSGFLSCDTSPLWVHLPLGLLCVSHGLGEGGAAVNVNLIKWHFRTSLVAQWLRIHLPMQGTRVRALVREDPTCRGAAKPTRHNYWACVPQLLSPHAFSPRWETRAPQQRVAPTRCN